MPNTTKLPLWRAVSLIKSTLSYDFRLKSSHTDEDGVIQLVYSHRQTGEQYRVTMAKETES